MVLERHPGIQCIAVALLKGPDTRLLQEFDAFDARQVHILGQGDDMPVQGTAIQLCPSFGILGGHHSRHSPGLVLRTPAVHLLLPHLRSRLLPSIADGDQAAWACFPGSIEPWGGLGWDGLGYG